MALVTLENEYLRLELAPEHGASVVNLAAALAGAWTPILRPTPPAEAAAGHVSGMASFTLAPFSNRLPAGRLRFAGREYQLRLNTPDGHTQHGDVRRRPWRTTAQAAARAAFTLDTRDFADFNYPFPFTAEIGYELAGPRCTTRFTLANVGAEPMPAGFGFHPYFPRTLTAPAENVELEAAAAGVYADLIPTTPAGAVPPALDFARRRPLAETPLNHCYAGWDGRAVIHWPRAGVTLRLEAEAPLRHLVLFAPAGQAFFAVEPVTNATNGFNLHAAGLPGSGTLVLAPGQAAAAAFHMTLSA